MPRRLLSHDTPQILATKGGLNISELAKQDLCVITNKTAPEAGDLQRFFRGQPVPLSTLANWTLIGLDEKSGLRQQLERQFAGRLERLRFGAQAGGWLAVKEYAKQGLGVGLVPIAVLSRDDVETLEVRRLTTECRITYFMIHREDARHRHLHTMKAELIKAARQHDRDIDEKWKRLV